MNLGYENFGFENLEYDLVGLEKPEMNSSGVSSHRRLAVMTLWKLRAPKMGFQHIAAQTVSIAAYFAPTRAFAALQS